MNGADLTHIDTWVFDLDNTLYPLESGVAEQASSGITDFVVKLTGSSREAAHALQKRYLADYGLTLNGLMRHHDVDPATFHASLHDISLDGLTASPKLRAAIGRLPGRRLIFTNADARHTERVLERLKLGDLFDDVFHIGSSDFVPKPAPSAYSAFVAAHAIEPRTAAFFEDSERNLEPAAALGMTTILVGAHAAVSVAPFVDYRTHHLAPFLAAARVKESR